MTHVVLEPTADVPTGLCVDDAGCPRCSWCQATPGYRHYHDHEWGFPVADDRRLFEKLCLEGFQSGLSWLTILNKREGFRAAFANFDAEQVAASLVLLRDAALVGGYLDGIDSTKTAFVRAARQAAGISR